MVAIVEASWQDIFDGKPLPESPVRKAFREAVEEVAQKARDVLPESDGRINSALKILLQGDVELLEDGTAKVASQSNGETKYFLVNGACECRDFAKAPGNFCEHRLAYGIFKRATALGQQKREAELDGKQPADPAPESPTEIPGTSSIPAQFLTTIHGKQFVQYAGLLAIAHERGLVNLSAKFISVDSDLALAEATAEFKDGRVFKECSDATPTNVHSKVKPHFARMALTRAKARALRDALNISMRFLEELLEA